MAYDVLQSCMLINVGLNKSECASWVQAWGSIFAILVAVGVPWSIRKADIRREQERNKSLAATAAVEIQMLVEGAGFALRAVKRDIQDAVERDPSIVRLGLAMVKLTALQRPPESSVEIIRREKPRLSVLLTVAYGEVDSACSRASQISGEAPDLLQARDVLEHFVFVVSKIENYFHQADAQLQEILKLAEFE